VESRTSTVEPMSVCCALLPPAASTALPRLLALRRMRSRDGDPPTRLQFAHCACSVSMVGGARIPSRATASTS
jgi:hypothetical protein